MANQLVLKVNVDDKGNFVIDKLATGIQRASKEAGIFGRVVKYAFVAAPIYEFMSLSQRAFTSSISSMLEYQKTLMQIKAVSQTGNEQMGKFSKTILDTSNNTEFSATNLAAATREIVKMGVSVDMTEKALQNAANLTTAGGGELQENAVALVNTANMFRLSADQLEHVANVVYGATAQSSISLQDFMETMKYAGPAAGAFGIKIEEVASMIAYMGNVGIKGSLAGTVLQNSFINLSTKATPAVKKALSDVNMQMMSFSQILQHLKKDGIGFADLLGTFDLRAIKGINVMIKDVEGAMDDFSTKLVDNQWSVAEAAKVVRDSWLDTFSIIKNNLVNNFLDETMSANMKDILAGVKSEVTSLLDVITANKDVIKSVLADGFTVAGAALKVMSEAIKFIIPNLKTIEIVLVGLAARSFADKYSKGFVELGAACLKSVFGVRALGTATAIAGTEAAVASGGFKTFWASVIGPIQVAIVAATALSAILDKIERKKDEARQNSARTDAEGIQNKINAYQEVLDKSKAAMDATERGISRPGMLGPLRSDKDHLDAYYKVMNQYAEQAAVKYSLDPSTFMGTPAMWRQNVETAKTYLKSLATVAEKITKDSPREYPDTGKDKEKGSGQGDRLRDALRREGDRLKAIADLAKDSMDRAKKSIADLVKLQGDLVEPGQLDNITGGLKNNLAALNTVMEKTPEADRKIIESTKEGAKQLDAMKHEQWDLTEAIRADLRDLELSTESKSVLERALGSYESNKNFAEQIMTEYKSTIDKIKALGSGGKSFKLPTVRAASTATENSVADIQSKIDLDPNAANVPALRAAQQAIRDEFALTAEEIKKKHFDMGLSLTQSAIDITNSIVSIIDSKWEREKAESKKFFDEQSANETAMYEQSLLLAEGDRIQKQLIMRKHFMDQKRIQIQAQAEAKKIAEKQKDTAIAMAWVNTAVAVVGAMAQTQVDIYGRLAAGAVALAAGIAQIAVIENQSFATGGWVKGNPRTTDNTSVNLAGGERIVSSQEVSRMGGKDSVDSLIERAQGNKSSQGQVILQVGTLIGDSNSYALLIDKLENAKRRMGWSL
jgi:TP901 family phage tail tape measure protein